MVIAELLELNPATFVRFAHQVSLVLDYWRTAAGRPIPDPAVLDLERNEQHSLALTRYESTALLGVRVAREVLAFWVQLSSEELDCFRLYHEAHPVDESAQLLSLIEQLRSVGQVNSINVSPAPVSSVAPRVEERPSPESEATVPPINGSLPLASD